ncbi:MAG: TonB-dependent receptor [Acidobacteria bacterium]|nr:TonB-dependent receptor [Acidobacteriota bacterium]
MIVAPVSNAQTNTGVIAGIVSDSTEAVISGAKITITHRELQVATEVMTNEVGVYVAPNLRAGPYQIRAEVTGFQTSIRTSLVLHVNDRLTVDFVMQPGPVHEVLEVTAAQPLIQPESAELAYLVENNRILDLPLDGRRYVDLMLLSPGVLPAPGVRDNPREGRINVNGNFSLQNYFVLNGVDNNTYTQNAQERSPQVVSPPPDALREFRIQTRTYTADFGWAVGGVINAEIKSGTNTFHGSGWWFHRNDDWNATDFFVNRAALESPEQQRNQAGFALGGPILRDRTFFFADYQLTDAKEGRTASGTVPTPAMKNGIFAGVRDLRDPSDVIPELAGCVDEVNDVINLAALRTDGRPCGDPAGMALVQLYPDPNQGTFGFTSAPEIPLDADHFDVRIDHRLADRDNLYGSYSLLDVGTIVERGPFPDPIATGGFSAESEVRGQLASLSWLHTFSPSILNEARFGFNLIRSTSEPLAEEGDAGPQFGLTGLPGTLAFGLPPIRVSGYSLLGTAEYRPQFARSQVWQALDNLSIFRGTHQMKFGFEFKRALNTFFDIKAPNGRYIIPDFWTGDGVANLLLGLVERIEVTTPLVAHTYTDGWMFYGQDIWRVTPAITLSYGLRYEYFTPKIERDRLISNFDPAANGGRGGVVTAFEGEFTPPACLAAFPCLTLGPSGRSVFARSLVHPDRNNIAPRVGYAWSPGERFVLRGGFGVYFQAQDRAGSRDTLPLNPPQVIDSSFPQGIGPTVPNRDFLLRDRFPAVPTEFIPAEAELRGIDMNARTPYSQQWSFGPEIQVFPNLAVDVSYVGQANHKLRKQRNINQGIIQTPGVGPAVRPFPDFADISNFTASDGNSNYHSLQVNVRKRFSRGYTFNVAYTWGKALGNVGDNLSGGPGTVLDRPQNAHDLAADYGRLVFDQRHRVVANGVWELPFGHGQPLLNKGFADRLLGNWQFNWIVSSTSGVPIAIFASDASQTGGGHVSRADCFSDPSGPKTVERFGQLFPGSPIFAQPAVFTFGNCGSSSLSSWWHHNSDLSLFKEFHIDEQRRFELRFEFLNAWNTPQFDDPNNDVNSGQFGETTQVLDPERPARVIQLGLKFYF